jgi:hypothetical protein
MVPAALSVAERLAETGAELSFRPLVPGAPGSTRGVIGLTGNRGLWFIANPGVHPKRGKRPPQPLMRYCWTIEKIVVVIQ